MVPTQPVISPGPDFLIIGAMKSATSAIYSYLIQHPRVIDRQPKELHFFTKPHLYERGVDWYLERFREKETSVGADRLLIGEASPSYLLFREAPSRVRSVLPDVRIIVSLRDPTERAISHYHHRVAKVGDEDRGIEEAFGESEIRKALVAIRLFEDEGRRPESVSVWHTARYLLNGHYSTLLKNWFDVFPSEQILVLDYDSLKIDLQGFMDEVYEFLGLPRHVLTDLATVYANRYPPAPALVSRTLSRYYEPHNLELKSWLDRRLGWLQ